MSRAFFALWAVITVSQTLAQTSPPSSSPVRFTVFAARPVANLSFAPRANAAPQNLSFYPTARSPRYEYRGAMPLRFSDAVSGAVVAEAAIPAEVRDALLLFSPIEPVPTTGLRYRISVLDDSAARRGAGELAVINLSGLAINGTVNQQEVTLKTGLNPALAVGRSAKILLHTSVKGRRYQAHADTFALARQERALLILFAPFYKGSLQVQSRLLLDTPPVVAPK